MVYFGGYEGNVGYGCLFYCVVIGEDGVDIQKGIGLVDNGVCCVGVDGVLEDIYELFVVFWEYVFGCGLDSNGIVYGFSEFDKSLFSVIICMMEFWIYEDDRFEFVGEVFGSVIGSCFEGGFVVCDGIGDGVDGFRMNIFGFRKVCWDFNVVWFVGQEGMVDGMIDQFRGFVCLGDGNCVVGDFFCYFKLVVVVSCIKGVVEEVELVGVIGVW